ncbi:MAG: ATP-dependent Clp protease proteolytic subunit [Halobacteriota archaeon]
MSEEIKFGEREKNPKIQESMQKVLDSNTAALAFIAPYAPAKISPTKALAATVDIPEELGIEDAINEIKKEREIRNLYLLLNSPGGGVSSSFKIARIIRDSFKDITIFIPHIAASGGTLIALAGNRIVMGEMSHLSLIDVQTERNGKMYSVNAMVRSFNNLNELFRTTPEEDAPYPWKAMANKLDPVEFQDWIDASTLMEKHAIEILIHENSSLKENAEEIVDRLSSGYPTHSYSITVNEAKEILGNVVYSREKEYSEAWNVMRNWLREYIMEESAIHFIRFVLPKRGEEKSGKE